MPPVMNVITAYGISESEIRVILRAVLSEREDRALGGRAEK